MTMKLLTITIAAAISCASVFANSALAATGPTLADVQSAVAHLDENSCYTGAGRFWFCFRIDDHAGCPYHADKSAAPGALVDTHHSGCRVGAADATSCGHKVQTAHVVDVYGTGVDSYGSGQLSAVALDQRGYVDPDVKQPLVSCFNWAQVGSAKAATLVRGQR